MSGYKSAIERALDAVDAARKADRGGDLRSAVDCLILAVEALVSHGEQLDGRLGEIEIGGRP